MKHIYLFLFFWLMLIGGISAQSENASWRFAAGVTAYSQNSFVEGEHPIEINMRYRVKGNHVLRIGIPFLNKTKDNVEGWGDISYEIQRLLEYANHGATGAAPWTYNKKLYGLNIGYDYTIFEWKNICFLGGFDLSIGKYTEFNKGYGLSVHSFNSENRFVSISNYSQNNKTKWINLKPFCGIRYQFKYLLGEFSIGPVVNTCKNSKKKIYQNCRTDFPDEIDIGNYKSKNTSTKVSLYCNLSFYITI